MNLIQGERVDLDRTARQWTYQFCSMFGFFQTPVSTTASETARSQALSLDNWQKYCKGLFGDEVQPNTTWVDDNYGNKTLKNAKNVVFLTAAEDPWREVTKTVNDTAYPTQIALYQNCDNCAHCIDLHPPSDSDAPEVVSARQSAQTYIKQWLGYSSSTANPTFIQ